MDSNNRRLSASRRNGIDHRSSASSNFLAVMQEKKLLKEAEEEERGRKTLNLAEDCTFCIFLWLSVDDLQRSSSVCKSWNSVIMERSFIEEHLHKSDFGLLCLSINYSEQPKNTVSMESLVQKQNGLMFQQGNLAEYRRQTRLHFLEIKNGVSFAELKGFNISCIGRVLGSCNGLVLLENKLKKGGLVVMNPTTRKVTPLSPGTIVHPNKEAYAFAYRSSTNEHIAVHLFKEESGRFSCEILTIEKRKWAMVKGPRLGLTIPLNHKPVFANGALYWLHDHYILSMEIEEMQFRSITLPKSNGLHDGIIELGGCLSFVTHELNQIHIWALNCSSEDTWTKKHTVQSGVLPDMTPVCGSKYDRWMILKSNSVYPVEDDVDDEDDDDDEDGLDTRRRFKGGEVRSMFIYDFGLGLMNKVRTKHLPLSFNAYIPHVNSLLCS